MSEFTVLALLTVASWMMRVALLALVPVSRLPRVVRSSLDHLAPAVLAAIAAVDLTDAVRADPTSAGLTLAAAAVIGLAAWRSRSVLVSSVVAIAAVCLLDLLLA